MATTAYIIVPLKWDDPKNDERFKGVVFTLDLARKKAAKILAKRAPNKPYDMVRIYAVMPSINKMKFVGYACTAYTELYGGPMFLTEYKKYANVKGHNWTSYWAVDGSFVGAINSSGKISKVDWNKIE